MKKIFLSFAFLGVFFLFSNDVNAQSSQAKTAKMTENFQQLIEYVEKTDLSEAERAGIQKKVNYILNNIAVSDTKKAQMRAKMETALED